AMGASVSTTEQELKAAGVIAILRGDFRWEQVAEIAEVLIDHDLRAVEYTWNSPNAAGVVTRLKQEYGDALPVGAGTLLSTEDVRAAAAAGAEFLITPHWSAQLSEQAQAEGLPLVPGVFTPSEVQAARSHGRRLLKLFPAGTGGPGHLRALKGPFHDVD